MGLVIRQSFKGFLVTILGTIIGFINIAYIFPRFLSPEQIGITRFLPEFAMVISGFTMLGMNHSMIRFYPKLPSEFANKSFGFWSFFIPTIGFVLFAVLWYFNQSWLNSFFNERAFLLTRYFYLVLPLLLFIVLISITETFSAIRGRIAIPKLNREVLFRIGMLLISVMLGVGWMDFSEFLVLNVGLYLIHLLGNLYYLRSLGPLAMKPKGIHSLDKNLLKDFFSFTFLILASSFAAVVLPRLDFIMISSMEGMADTGIYTLAFTIAMVIEIPRRALEQITAPIISQRIHEDNQQELKKLYKESAVNQTLLGGLIFLLLWVNLDAIFYFMPNGHIYATGKLVFFILGVGKLWELSAGPGAQIIANSSFYKYTILMGIISTFAGIGLNVWLIPFLGINGAAMATVISYGLLSIYTIGIIYYKMKIFPFDAKMILLFLLLVIAVALHHWLNFDFIQSTPLRVLVQSVVFIFPFITLIYKLNISPSLNKVVLDYSNQLLSFWRH